MKPSTESVDIHNDPFTREVIRRKVNQLLNRTEFAGEDADDLTQEFLGRVTSAMASYRSDVGHRNPFIVTIVERHVARMLEHRQAAMRAAPPTASLSVIIRDKDIGPTEFAQTIGQDEQGRRLSMQRRISEREHADLKHDLALLMAELPPQWQEFLRLRATHTISEVSREMGVHRTTLSTWMQRIAEIFEKAGLREYLS